MKKSKVIAKPTRLSDLSFDDLYVDDFDASFKTSRLDIQKKRDFKRYAD